MCSDIGSDESLLETANFLSRLRLLNDAGATWKAHKGALKEIQKDLDYKSLYLSFDVIEKTVALFHSYSDKRKMTASRARSFFKTITKLLDFNQTDTLESQKFACPQEMCYNKRWMVRMVEGDVAKVLEDDGESVKVEATDLDDWVITETLDKATFLRHMQPLTYYHGRSVIKELTGMIHVVQENPELTEYFSKFLRRTILMDQFNVDFFFKLNKHSLIFPLLLDLFETSASEAQAIFAHLSKFNINPSHIDELLQDGMLNKVETEFLRKGGKRRREGIEMILYLVESMSGEMSIADDVSLMERIQKLATDSEELSIKYPSFQILWHLWNSDSNHDSLQNLTQIEDTFQLIHDNLKSRSNDLSVDEQTMLEQLREINISGPKRILHSTQESPQFVQPSNFTLLIIFTAFLASCMALAGNHNLFKTVRKELREKKAELVAVRSELQQSSEETQKLRISERNASTQRDEYKGKKNTSEFQLREKKRELKSALDSLEKNQKELERTSKKRKRQVDDMKKEKEDMKARLDELKKRNTRLSNLEFDHGRIREVELQLEVMEKRKEIAEEKVTSLRRKLEREKESTKTTRLQKNQSKEMWEKTQKELDKTQSERDRLQKDLDLLRNLLITLAHKVQESFPDAVLPSSFSSVSPDALVNAMRRALTNARNKRPKLQRTEEKLNQLQNENEELKNSKYRYQRQIEAMNKSFEERRAIETSEYRSQLSSARRKIDDLNEDMKDLRGYLDGKKDQVQKLRQKNDKLSRENERLEERFNALDLRLESVLEENILYKNQIENQNRKISDPELSRGRGRGRGRGARRGHKNRFARGRGKRDRYTPPPDFTGYETPSVHRQGEPSMEVENVPYQRSVSRSVARFEEEPQPPRQNVGPGY